MNESEITNLMRAISGPIAEHTQAAMKPLEQRIAMLGETIIQLSKRIAELERQR
jgi:hypothetical protein